MYTNGQIKYKYSEIFAAHIIYDRINKLNDIIRMKAGNICPGCPGFEKERKFNYLLQNIGSKAESIYALLRVNKLNSIMHAGSKRSLGFKIERKLRNLCPNLESETESIPCQGR
uniref:Uncharacterized protein n=1 Tax=Glossina pallidipes TaxID=7398 RepID=A0A1B0A587_GLOPL